MSKSRQTNYVLLQTLQLNSVASFQQDIELKVAHARSKNNHVEEKKAFDNKKIELGRDAEKNPLVVSRYLGGGTFGDVFLGEWNTHCLAIKKIDIKNNVVGVLAEIAAMKRLKKEKIPNVIGYYFAVSDYEQYYFIGMEYANGGSLDDFIKSHRDKSWALLLSILADCVAGLDGIHRLGLFHGDIKSSNVLIMLGMYGAVTAVLADFYTTSTVDLAKETNAKTGSTLWMAPELFKEKKHNDQVTDMYSFGVLMWKCITWKVEDPFYFATKNMSKLSEFIAYRDYASAEKQFPIPRRTPLPLKNLMFRCVNKTPAMRPTSDGALSMLTKLKK